MKIKSLPQEERPVEKTLSKGPASLSNAELLAILLGSGTREKSAIGLAEEILSRSERGIGMLGDLSCEELMELPGIGPFKAARIAASVELGRRIATRPKEKRVSVRCRDDVADIFMEDMRHERKEYFKALLLNTRGEIISVETISVGELNQTPVHPREAFAPAVKKGAYAVIFAHNHPSGDPTPSGDDILTTERLMEAGKLLGIQVLDHIVIGDGVFTSAMTDD